MIRKIIISASCLFAALGIAVVTMWLLDNRISNFTGNADIYVTPGMTAENVIEQLDSSIVVRRHRGLERVFRKKEVARYLKPGHYVVKTGHTNAYVARMLNNGWQTPVSLVLSGNLRLRDRIAAKIASQLMVDSASVRRSFEDAAFLSAYGVTPETVFSLFVPDTYEMYWTASVADIFDAQKAANDAFWTQDRLDAARQLGLNRLEVSTLASIVRGESNYPPELSKIAGVYLNRLRRGIKLQADPTVAFCYDYSLNRVLLRHLMIDSPYNTYMYAGLPPAPICIPPKEYIDAVLHPDYGGGNLFFCANPDFSSTHVFAKTFIEHEANARAYRRELDRRAAEKKQQR